MQGSVLGPILFVYSTADRSAIVERPGLDPHLYVDATQVWEFAMRFTAFWSVSTSGRRPRPLDVCQSSTSLPNKLEVFLRCSARRSCVSGSLNVWGCIRRPIAFSASRSMMTSSCALMEAARCFGVRRQLRSVRRCVTTPSSPVVLLKYMNLLLVVIGVHSHFSSCCSTARHPINY